jgi:FKBP-type peptidyl-prolyl cis-trans isomerase FkpA
VRAAPRAVLAVAVAGAFGLSACGYADPYATSAGTVANESPGIKVSPSPGVDDFNAGSGLPVVTYPDGLQYIDITVGTGALAHSNDAVVVQYTGWLSDGTSFDSSRTGGTPFPVDLNANPPQVILGWVEGIPGMKVGGKRMLIIPGPLAYGSAGKQDPNTGANIIPPNATLTFEIELLSLTVGPSPSPIPTPIPSPTPSPSPSPSPSKSP